MARRQIKKHHPNSEYNAEKCEVLYPVHETRDNSQRQSFEMPIYQRAVHHQSDEMQHNEYLTYHDESTENIGIITPHRITYVPVRHARLVRRVYYYPSDSIATSNVEYWHEDSIPNDVEKIIEYIPRERVSESSVSGKFKSSHKFDTIFDVIIGW
jgi:hypothetical protein